MAKTEKEKKPFSAKKKPDLLKKIWNTYLKRLNKVTKGKPQCCK